MCTCILIVFFVLGGSGQSRDESLQQQRQNLPIYPARKRLLKEIAKASSVIIIGETGSGKSTQIPQVKP